MVVCTLRKQTREGEEMKDFIEVFVNQFDGNVRARLGCGQKPSPQEKLVRLLVQVPETVKPTANPIKVYFAHDMEDSWLVAELPNSDRIYRDHWVDLKRECEKVVPMASFVWADDQPAWTLAYAPAELLPVPATNPVPTQAPAPADTTSERGELPALSNKGYRVRSKHSIGGHIIQTLVEGAKIEPFHSGGIVTDPEGFVKGFGIGISQLGDGVLGDNPLPLPSKYNPKNTYAKQIFEQSGFIYNKPDTRPEVKDQRTLDMILNDGSSVKGKSNRYTWTDSSNPKGVWMWRVSQDDSAPNVPDTVETKCPQVDFNSYSLAEKMLQSLVQGFASKFQKHTQVPGSLAKGKFWIIFSDGALVPVENYTYDNNGYDLAPVYIAERD